MSRDRNPGTSPDRQAPTRRDRARAAFALRTLRQYRGLTQKGLAELSGVHNATISAYERGQRSIGSDNLTALLAGLGIPERAWEATVRHIRWLDFFTQAKRGADEPVTETDFDLFAETVGRDVEQSALDLLRLLRAPFREDRNR